MAEKTNLEKYTVVLALIGFIASTFFSAFALYQANDLAKQANNLTQQSLIIAQEANNLTQASLQLQNIISNFKPQIFPSAIADLDSFTYTNGSTTPINAQGSLNISMIALSPHLQVINFSLESSFNFTVSNIPSYGVGYENITDQTLLDPEKENLTHVNFYLGRYFRGQFLGYPDAVIQPYATTPVNFTIPIDATLYLNPQWFRMMGHIIYLNTVLGKISINAYVYDVQTEITTNVSFSTYLFFSFSVLYA